MPLDELIELLNECAEHLDGVTGAASRPNSDSGDLYFRIIDKIKELEQSKGPHEI